MYKTCRVHKEQICSVATTRYVLHIHNSACTLQLWHVQEKLHCYTWQYSRGYIPTSASGETGIQKSHAWSQKIPAYNNCIRGVWSAGVLKHSEIFKTSLFNIFLPQRETRRTTHTHPSCLASKGKISSFLWSGYTCASLAYWVSQKAILISDHYFFTLEEGQRNSYCIPLRNILKSYTQQPAGVSRFFSQLFCIANTSSVEAAFPVTHRQLWEGRGEGGGAVERQLCGHLGQQHKGGTRRKIGGARSQNAQVPKYAEGRTHSKVGC